MGEENVTGSLADRLRRNFRGGTSSPQTGIVTEAVLRLADTVVQLGELLHKAVEQPNRNLDTKSILKWHSRLIEEYQLARSLLGEMRERRPAEAVKHALALQKSLASCPPETLPDEIQDAVFKARAEVLAGLSSAFSRKGERSGQGGGRGQGGGLGC